MRCSAILILSGAALLLLFSQCQEIPVLPRGFSSNPTSFDFGAVHVGDCKNIAIIFSNIGDTVRSIGARLSSPAFHMWTGTDWGLYLDTTFVYPDESSSGFYVYFCPPTIGNFRDTLRILGRDTITVLMRIPLHGSSTP